MCTASGSIKSSLSSVRPVRPPVATAKLAGRSTPLGSIPTSQLTSVFLQLFTSLVGGRLDDDGAPVVPVTS